jgi:hypothetical protein
MATDETHFFDKVNETLFAFNEEGMFVDENGQGPQKGFKASDEFSDWLHSYVERRLDMAGLVRLLIPDDPNGAPIYHTPGALSSPQNLLVLICGSGRIHVGLWSVGVCAWHGLNAGSVLPCLEEAKKRNMEVIVLNPNHKGANLLPGKEFGMVRHSVHVWKELIMPAAPANIYIICHSMGGECTHEALSVDHEFAVSRVRAIALTDAFCDKFEDAEMDAWLRAHAINWVCRSNEEINVEIASSAGTQMRSAGTNDHPLSTHKAFPFIWEFFDQMSQV